jgi:hypothetical protein
MIGEVFELRRIDNVNFVKQLDQRRFEMGRPKGVFSHFRGQSY